VSIDNVNLGASPDGAGGDNNREAFTKVNAALTELAPGIVSKTSDYTLTNADANKTIRVTGDVTITLPPDLDDAFTCTIVNVGSDVVDFAKGSGVTTNPDTLPELDNTGDAEVTVAWVQHVGSDEFDVVGATAEPVTLGFALSDEDSDLATGTALTFRMPFAMIVDDIRFTVNTAPTGAALQFDVNEAGATVLSTKATIDAGEKTTVTAATPAVISDNSWADDAEMTIDIDQIGSTVAGAGAKVWIYGYKA
jgi:hypothetical protein